MDVSAVLVTRGDVGLNTILNTLGACPSIREVIVYNNEGQIERYADGGLFIDGGTVYLSHPDLAVYGRYRGIESAHHPVIYVQDDDCLIDAEAIIARYEAGRLVANMPQSRWADYPDSTMVGWGAVFDRDLPQRAWDKFNRANVRTADGSDIHPVFLRTADVVFSALVPRTVIDVGFQHLPWAEDPARAMFKQPGHKAERDWILDLCRQLRVLPDDDRRG